MTNYLFTSENKLSEELYDLDPKGSLNFGIEYSKFSFLSQENKEFRNNDKSMSLFYPQGQQESKNNDNSGYTTPPSEKVNEIPKFPPGLSIRKSPPRNSNKDPSEKEEYRNQIKKIFLELFPKEEYNIIEIKYLKENLGQIRFQSTHNMISMKNILTHESYKIINHLNQVIGADKDTENLAKTITKFLEENVLFDTDNSPILKEYLNKSDIQSNFRVKVLRRIKRNNCKCFSCLDLKAYPEEEYCQNFCKLEQIEFHEFMNYSQIYELCIKHGFIKEENVQIRHCNNIEPHLFWGSQHPNYHVKSKKFKIQFS